MDGQISIPLDSDGFMRRECPHCEDEFKWHHGPANEEAEGMPDPHVYHCPLCGNTAGPDSWWTQAQLEAISMEQERVVHQTLNDELGKMFRGSRSKGISFKPGPAPIGPAPMVEPDDMVIVASPCHEYEPIKVPEAHLAHLYCLICGSEFAV